MYLYLLNLSKTSIFFKDIYTFRFSGAVLFNNLPTSIKEATSLSLFKNFLGFHFSD